MKRPSDQLIMVLLLCVPLSAVVVNSALCPTNKIAPRRRAIRGREAPQGRTLGAFYDLLAPGNPGYGGPQGYNPALQEEPQKDDPDDCGDIEDYDEHDLTSLLPHYQRGDDNGYGRLFFGLFNNPQSPPRPQYPPSPGGQHPQQPQYQPNGPQYPPNRPQYPPNRPQQQQPQRPIRPPYSSGGYFENNPYRPPIQHDPSDSIKPVYDGVQEQQTTYRPHVVGGPVGHVVGVTPKPRPTRHPDYYTTNNPNYVRYPTNQASYNRYSTRRTEHSTQRTQSYYDRYPQRSTQPPYTTTRRTGPRQLNDNNDSIIGSFLDLLFK